MNEFYITPDYGYEPFTEMPGAASDAFGVAGVMLGFFVVFYLAFFAFAIVSYILQSFGLYTIAKRRGINNPWLAWVPVGVMWILGSISDQYQYVAKGRVRNRRKVLLGVEIALYLLLIPLIISVIAAIVGIAMESAGGAGVGILVLLVSYLAMIVLSIVLLVFYYIALHDVFASCDPYNATTYLILSIFFAVALPFFIFFSRKKDAGMPPRREEAQPAPVQPLPIVEAAPVQEAPIEETPVAEATPVVEETPAENPEVAETAEETE